MAIHRFFLSACAALFLNCSMLGAHSKPDFIKDRMLPAAIGGAVIAAATFAYGWNKGDTGAREFSKGMLAICVPLAALFWSVGTTNSNTQESTHEN